MTMNLIVTTVQHPSDAVENLGIKLSAMLQVPFVERFRYSLDALKKEYGTECVVIASQKGPIAHTPGGEFFFHLNMAELRIKNILNGKHDHMVTAMELTTGMSVLDCTLGLATDAIVASFVTGETGQVTGLEVSPLIAVITRYGLSNFTCETPALTNALRRISVENIDYISYLTELADNSFDVVYFDPMFRVPITTSSNLKPLRCLADSRPLTPEILSEARRIAKKRIIVKENRRSGEFDRLGVDDVAGGKYSSVHYGIINIARPGG